MLRPLSRRTAILISVSRRSGVPLPSRTPPSKKSRRSIPGARKMTRFRGLKKPPFCIRWSLPPNPRSKFTVGCRRHLRPITFPWSSYPRRRKQAKLQRGQRLQTLGLPFRRSRSYHPRLSSPRGSFRQLRAKRSRHQLRRTTTMRGPLRPLLIWTGLPSVPTRLTIYCRRLSLPLSLRLHQKQPPWHRPPSQNLSGPTVRVSQILSDAVRLCLKFWVSSPTTNLWSQKNGHLKPFP